MVQEKPRKTAIWVITPNGMRLALKISEQLSETDSMIFVSKNPQITAVCSESRLPVVEFDRLKSEVHRRFHEFEHHVMIMSTGIVVRIIAPVIDQKTSDPAVVVMDDRGFHVISLLSGHIGGANELAQFIGRLTGASPVITTATDVNDLPAIDVIAVKNHLKIENPECIKRINMAVLTGNPVDLYDPFSYLPHENRFNRQPSPDSQNPSIMIDDRICPQNQNILILRPKSLFVGIGCNRNTPELEIKDLLTTTFEKNNLSMSCIAGIGTIDIKQDEPGIIDLAKHLELPLFFFDKPSLDSVKTIISPSRVVEKHIGVKSVCEAAAILSANRGELIVPKQKTPNVTLAVARQSFTS